MALLFKSIIAADCMMGVWTIEEDFSTLMSQLTLNNNEEARLMNFGNENKKLQFLASRLLLKDLTNGHSSNIGYNEFGKPFIINSNHKISISHSYRYVALIINKYFETGIDIELIKPKIFKISNRFLSKEEIAYLGEEHILDKLYIYWGAKESLYKLYGNRNLIFKDNIFIDPFNYDVNGGFVNGRILKNEYMQGFMLAYRKIAEYMLVYVHNN